MAPKELTTTTDVQHLSPLMQPVTYDGQQYFTSQYFHQQYLANSSLTGKYRQHSHFVRLLRSIEPYRKHLDRGDIVEITWHRVNTEGIQNRDSFKPLFQAAGWNPLTLLNATAQLAMSHHLDDELSKQMSVATNARMAQQMTGESITRPLEDAHRDLAAALAIAALLEVPKYLAQQEAVKMVAQTTGVDLRPMLLTAPAQDNIAPDEVMLEPTELAKALGMPYAKDCNTFLARAGWQIRTAIGWEPTAVGKPFAVRHAWVSGNKTGYNWKWNVSAVQHLWNERYEA